MDLGEYFIFGYLDAEGSSYDVSAFGQACLDPRLGLV